MLVSSLVALAASAYTASAQVYQGFNYGSTYSNGSAITEPAYEARFNAAKNLVGTSSFTSARIFTLIQAETPNSPSDAIQAAVNTKTSLLLGLWASAGQANIDNELAALSSALSAHGSTLADLVAGISVGSEDLYRISPIGIENESGVGAGPDEVANYIGQVKRAISNTALAGKPVGHVDTWTAWVNSSNNAVIAASDFIGMDAYPYFQNTMTNDIGNGYSLFSSAYEATVSSAGGKPVYVTETGWPVSGKTENLAVPSTENAKAYWDQVGCGRLFGKVNTWWFTLQDAFPDAPNPSFGIVGAGSSIVSVPTTPLYDLSCSDASSDVPSTASAAPSSTNPDSSAEAVGNNGAQRQNQIEQSDGRAASGNTSGSEKAAQSSTTTVERDRPQTIQPTITVASTATAPTTLITKTTALPAASGGASGCPASLSGQYEYPHLIVPIDKDNPGTAQGPSFNGTFSPSISSIFNFDYPGEYSGKTCTLVFLLPTQDKLTSSAFSLAGSGGLNFELLKDPASELTTYNNAPPLRTSLGGLPSISPGNEYVIASAPCPAGSRRGVKVSATGDLNLNYFQDYDPSPIGLFSTVC